MSNVLIAKYLNRYSAIAAAGLFGLMLVKHFVFLIPELGQYRGYGTLILMIYSMLTLLLLYKNTLFEKLIWWGIYYFALIIMELLTILLLNLVLNKDLDVILNDQISGYIIILGKLLLIPLYELIIRRRKGKLVIGVSYHKELSVVILFNAVLLIVLVYIFNNKHDLVTRIDQVILFVFGVVLFITVYTCILIFRLEKKSKEELSTQLRLQQIELELKLNEDMVSITDKLRKLRHDMNNHIGLIKTLVQVRQYDELEEYINQMYEDVEIANELVISGNKTLAVLVNAKKSLAKSKNIEFDSLITASDINMKNKDICSLLGNILDNAIEAAEKTVGKKYIELMIQKTEEGCIISCENSLGAKPIMKKGKFITLKDNSFIHGLGTENIKEIVSKYQGQINFDYDDEMFNVRVVMPV